MIRHIAGIAEIVPDVAAAVGFYRDILGLEVEHEPGSGYATIEIPGILHFGLWGREQAAAAVYGEGADPTQIPLGFSIGFEVDDVEEDIKTTQGKGLAFVQPPKTEPWGQVTSRFHSPSIALCEFSQTPWARKIIQSMEVEKNE
ncbi:MAG: VOC family protein [Anaerolineales bacterium]|jgi:catechol 2,3-dioxygenase-like lactoylglutathione lyase family enzyme